MSSTKRKRSESEDDSEANKRPEPLNDAARFNNLVMRTIQKALATEPEVDIAGLLPSQYSSRLDAMRLLPKIKQKDYAEAIASSLRW